MSITKAEKEKVITSVTDYLSTVKSATRKDVIESVLNGYGFSNKEKNNKAPDSKYNKIRSYIGSVLTDMHSNGGITKENDKYSLKKESTVVVKEEQCRSAILSFLRKKSYKKKDLYIALQKHFKTDKTQNVDDDNALKSMAGQILTSLCNSKEIILENGSYSVAVESTKKVYSKLPVSEDAFEKLFLERLTDNGGRFFEKFVANLFERYFTINEIDVLNCDIVGGANDGGIDVIIDIVDDIGFKEQIMIQAKCRKNLQITEKEVREFYGALNALGGTRGIFITTSTFHSSAEKFINTIHNCVKIDGYKVFDLVKKTTYGIRKYKDGYLFDDTIFNI